MRQLFDWIFDWLRAPTESAQSESARPYHPPVLDPEKVGTYPALTKSGAGLVWDEVLEYRVWSHPERGAPDEGDGEDYYYAFDNYPDALAFSVSREGAEKPLALVLQREHINEPEPGKYEHVTEQRIAEWRVEWLKGTRRTPQTIPDFFNPDAPATRLKLLGGEGE